MHSVFISLLSFSFLLSIWKSEEMCRTVEYEFLMIEIKYNMMMYDEKNITKSQMF